ncbi:uncharacterized protein lrrc53 [Syngnathus scovelli]|uniref:uncharacterized protein lrrc53 n=1 Tax=Syngnathus scovelli TaxID=161590 RepID=UPI002110D09A|nr:uncharacterized protein lrrc53 [Syngnathus scovelli]
MVCVSVDNPAVTTVLELTDANCVPSNQNITVQIETRDSVTPQVYARDLAITAVLCFVGGIGLTLLVVLICYQVSRRQKRKGIPKQRDPEEGSGPVSNFTAKHHDVAEKPRELFLQAHQLLDNESIPWDSRTENYRSQFHNRVEDDVMCPDCKVQGLKLNRWDNRMNGVMEGDRRLSQQDILGRDIPHNVLSRDSCRSSSHQRKHNFIPAPEALAAFHANNEMGVERRHPAILHCNSCHQTFNMNESKNHPHVRDTSVSHVNNRRRISDYDRFDAMNNTNIRKQRRNVTFNTERRDQGKSRRTNEAKKPRNMARGTEKNHKGKLHLPFGKTKVHPKRKPEQDRHNSKRKKDRKQSEGNESSGEQSKRSSKKASESDGVHDGEDKKDGGKDQKVSSLSLQDENIFINTTTSAGGSLVSPAPTSPKMVGSRSMSLSGASNSLQEGFISPGTPLLANAGNANHLQTIPLYTSLPGGLQPNVSVNSSLNPILSQSPLDSSTLEPRVKADPRLDEGFCTGDRQSPRASGSELPITASQSFNRFKTENGTATGGLLDSKSVGGRPETKVQAVSRVSTLAADVFPEGASTQSTSSSGCAKATSPLLQQEYLEEESGSSSRRKLRLVLPEKTSSREPTALEKKIR